MRIEDRDSALKVLEEAADRAPKEKPDPEPIRAALRALLPFSTDRQFLIWFWESIGYDEPIGRSQNMRAALNGIIRHLEPDHRPRR